MRILYFANANNYHTIKWCRYFARQGHEVHVASLEKPANNSLLEAEGVMTHWLENGSSRLGSDLQKLGYLFTAKAARKLIAALDPDIVHAHYASSYGVVCSLACKRPYCLSVWGSDVYDFPHKSPLHRGLLKYALKKCTWLLSTSEAMAEETRKYTDKPIEITPFGVDMDLFNPSKRTRADDGKLVIGTVKGLEKKYGIDTLLHATALLRNRRPDLTIELRIAGAGTMEMAYKRLAQNLGVDICTHWLGHIPQEDAAHEWANFDIAVITSRSESFGVSAVEAQACGTPLVITDIPGLMEACHIEKTAVIPKDDPKALSGKLEELAINRRLRKEMGAQGRRYVLSRYEIGDCFGKVDPIYKKAIETGK